MPAARNAERRKALWRAAMVRKARPPGRARQARVAPTRNQAIRRLVSR